MDFHNGHSLSRHVCGAGISVAQMTLRQFLHDNFGWDIYDWADDEIRF
jgi:hypothetical protein